MNTVQDIKAGMPPSDPLLRKLSHHSALSDKDADELQQLQRQATRLAAGVRLQGSEYPLDTALVVKKGWVMSYSELEDGRRQILRFALPGDLILFNRAFAPTYALASETITRSELARISFGSISEVAQSNPALGRALEDEFRRETDRLGSQVLRLGRLTAYERAAHLIAELFERCAVIGQVSDNTMPFPLTQSVVADALGLSLVHVNRQFGQLRSKGIITLKKKRMTIHDRDALMGIANGAGALSAA